MKMKIYKKMVAGYWQLTSLDSTKLKEKSIVKIKVKLVLKSSNKTSWSLAIDVPNPPQILPKQNKNLQTLILKRDFFFFLNFSLLPQCLV